MLRNTAAALAMLVALLPSATHAQTARDYRAPYAHSENDLHDQTLAGWLEPQFTEMMQVCLRGPFVLRKHLNDHEMSGIPFRLVQILGLNNSPYIVDASGEALSRRFGAVYLDSAPARSLDSDDHSLVLRLQSDEDRMPNPAMDVVQYVSSCASVVQAAGDVKGGYSVPTASISASVAAQTSNNSAFTIDLIKGHFESPLFAMYNGLLAGADPQEGRAFASMLFAQWYENHNDRIDQPNFMLDWFDGVTIYRTERSRASSEVNFNSSHRVEIPGVSSAGSLSISSSREANLYVANFGVAINYKAGSTDPSWHFTRIPSMNLLQTSILNYVRATLDRDHSDLRDIWNAQPRSFHETLDDVPELMCNRSWRTTNPAVQVVDATRAARSDHLRGCNLTLSFTPDENEQQDRKTVTFNLVYALDPARAHEISVRGDPIEYRVEHRPVLNRSATPIDFRSNSTNATWTIDFELDDLGVAQGLTTSGLSFSCESGVLSGSRVITGELHTPQSGMRRLTISIAVPADEFHPELDTQNSGCRLSGNIGYRLGDLGTATRPIDQIRLPVRGGPTQ